MKSINEYNLRQSIKKVLKEEFNSIQLQDALDNVEKIIKHYDTIDCNDYPTKEYEEVYCNHYNGVSLENMNKIRDAIDSKLKSLIYNEFKNKSSWMR
jgi:hypothetical protein